MYTYICMFFLMVIKWIPDVKIKNIVCSYPFDFCLNQQKKKKNNSKQ